MQRVLLQLTKTCSSTQGSAYASYNSQNAFQFCRKTSSWIGEAYYTRRRRVVDIPDTDVAFGLTLQMRAFMGRVQETRPDPWFHRKSDTLVLSVVHVNFNGVPYFFEGMNAEVSLPTGSICAERSAILHARAKLPGLRREDFVGVAVLEVPLVPYPVEPSRNPMPPCGACREWLLKFQEKNPSLTIVTYSGTDLEEVEECLPDGRNPSLRAGEGRLHVTRLTNTEEHPIAVEMPDLSDKGHRRKERLVSRLIARMGSGQQFSKNRLRRKMPWFPAWWLDDLVEGGFLLQQTVGERIVYQAVVSSSACASHAGSNDS